MDFTVWCVTSGENNDSIAVYLGDLTYNEYVKMVNDNDIEVLEHEHDEYTGECYLKEDCDEEHYGEYEIRDIDDIKKFINAVSSMFDEDTPELNKIEKIFIDDNNLE